VSWRVDGKKALLANGVVFGSPLAFSFSPWLWVSLVLLLTPNNQQPPSNPLQRDRSSGCSLNGLSHTRCSACTWRIITVRALARQLVSLGSAEWIARHRNGRVQHGWVDEELHVQ